MDLSGRKRGVDTVQLLHPVTHFPALDGYHSPCWGQDGMHAGGGQRAFRVGVVKD